MSFNEYWNHIYKLDHELYSSTSLYWRQYSNPETWQFWVVLILLVCPLIILYFAVDRKRIFEVFFFGYTYHMLWTYTDLVLSRGNLFIHQYFITPFLPYSINITASLLPVGYLLVYQYCTNREKNFYLYGILVSAIFSFVFAPLEKYVGILKIREGFNYLDLFLIDVMIMLLTFWFTKFVLKMKNG